MTNKSKFAGLIVAAGYSSRMGQFKPLLACGAKTILEQAIASLQTADLAEILVVLGYRAEELRPVVEQSGAKVVLNPAYAEGMYTSIIAGLTALSSNSAGFLLLPGDIPLVQRQTLKQIVQKFRQGAAELIYPCFRGQRGHPPLISARFIPDLLEWQGTGGLQAYLRQFNQQALELETGDQGILLDIDTPADYQYLQAYYQKLGTGRSLPGEGSK